MQKVITINLNGNAYQIDEGGYAALVAYLEGAERQLKDNPDRAEIIKDLEQAIADKCRAFLSPHKTVVTAAEVDQIVREMGPVEGADTRTDGASAPAADAGPQPSARTGPRRLYRIQEDAVWMGVCSGIAAYIGIDPVFVRIVFALLIVWSAGLGLIGYWILARIIPEANTSDERSAAHGQPPLSAQELIDRAKKNYADFKDSRDWRGDWRRNRREWRRQWRATRWHSYGWSGWGNPVTAPAAMTGGHGSRVFAGVLVPILSLASMALFWCWLYAIYSLVTRQAVLGQPLPDEVPLWLGLIILMVIYQAAAWPLHAMRRSMSYAFGGPYHGSIAAIDGLLTLGFVLVGIWMAAHYVPELREFLRSFPDIWDSLRF